VKRIVYVEWLDTCCRWADQTPTVYYSHDDLLSTKAIVARLHVADEDAEPWGDDWNDAPACANAGPPYREAKNYQVIDLRLGDPWPALATPEIERRLSGEW